MSGFTWIDQLLPASWRGVPFGVYDSGERFGRRQAVHEYPFRDTPWVEDMGRATRSLTISGFTVGDDCYLIRDAMAAAAELRGPGLLIHPSLGPLSVSLLTFGASERRELGRVVQFEFEFAQGGNQLFPVLSDSTQSATADAVSSGTSSVGSECGATAGPAFAEGAPVAGQAAFQAAQWTALAQTLVRDPRALFASVGGLGAIVGGDLGRYSAGRMSAAPSGAVAPAAAATNAQGRLSAAVAGLLAGAVSNVTAVGAASSDLADKGGAL